MSGCGYVGGAVQSSVEATTSCTSCYISIGVWRTPLLPQSGVASHCTDAIVLGGTNDATTERTAHRPASVEQRHFSRGPQSGSSCRKKYASRCQGVGLRIRVGACNLEEQRRIARQSEDKAIFGTAPTCHQTHYALVRVGHRRWSHWRERQRVIREVCFKSLVARSWKEARCQRLCPLFFVQVPRTEGTDLVTPRKCKQTTSENFEVIE